MLVRVGERSGEDATGIWKAEPRDLVIDPLEGERRIKNGARGSVFGNWIDGKSVA